MLGGPFRRRDPGIVLMVLFLLIYELITLALIIVVIPVEEFLVIVLEILFNFVLLCELALDRDQLQGWLAFPSRQLVWFGGGRSRQVPGRQQSVSCGGEQGGPHVFADVLETVVIGAGAIITDVRGVVDMDRHAVEAAPPHPGVEYPLA
jgi:hypothetical protein